MNKEKWNLDNSYLKLPALFFTEQLPVSVRNAELVIFNEPLATKLEIPRQPEVFAGSEIPEGSRPLAQAYAGHQFGYFTMLGDGRALLLGEQIISSGERFDVQLKGSGRTPYSRGGDGRAALGPMLREYIISEAMHALGIPTTRSLAVTKTGETVIREKQLKGAILTRIAASHLRVGTFEYASYFGKPADLKKLADYTIWRHFPTISKNENQYLDLLREVIKRQATLISKWQLVGFIHGVMNTDNMALSGETIDYGPCAFMDTYDPDTVFSSVDQQGRYAYGNQPKIAVWNLARFAETLLPLLHEQVDEAVTLAKKEVKEFWQIYHHHLLLGMRGKLGLFNEESGDKSLFEELLEVMQKFQADYTNTFRLLTLDQYETIDGSESAEFSGWYERWQARLNRQSSSSVEAQELMKKNNPAIIPRNHRVEEALAAAEAGDNSVMEKLLHVLSHPYAYSSEQEEYTILPNISACRYQTFCGT